MRLQQEASKVSKNVFPGIMLEAQQPQADSCPGYAARCSESAIWWKASFYLFFRHWKMEQFPGEKISSLVRDRGSSFTENAPPTPMVAEMHLVLCLYFILNVKVSGT